MKQSKIGWLLSIALLHTVALHAKQGVVDSLMQQASAISRDTAKVNYLIKIVEDSLYKNPKLAVELGVKAVYLAKQTASTPHIRESLNSAGKACYYAGLVGEASKFVIERMELVQEKGSLIDQAKAYNDLGLVVHWSKGDKEAVIKNLEESLRLFQKDAAMRKDTTPIQALVSVYNNLGFITLEQRKYAVSEQYILKGIAIARKTENTQDDFISLLLNYGILLMQTNRYVAAWEYLNEGLVLSEKTGNNVRHSVALYYIGDWYAQQGDLTGAMPYYMQSFEESFALEIYSSVQDIAIKLSELHQNLGNAAEGLKYLNIARDAEANVKRWESKAEVDKMELRAKFKTWEKEMVVEQMKQRKVFLIIMLSLVSLIVVSIYLYGSTRKKYRMAQLKQLDTELTSQKLLLEKELLEVELQSKDKQLTTEILHKIRKNELIEEVVQKLLGYIRQVKPDARQVLGDAVKYLQDATDHEPWNEFETRFNKVHTSFYEKLHAVNPTLTIHERRLCAFLKLNMSTKEISALTGQSVRAVELMRGRVRKKLELTNTETSLTEFLGSL